MEIDGLEDKQPRAKSTKRVTFEIDRDGGDEEVQDLIVGGNIQYSPRRGRRKKKLTICTRVFCCVALLALAIFLVMAGLYWTDHAASVVPGTEVESVSLNGDALMEALHDEGLSTAEKLSLLPKTNVQNNRMLSLYSSSARQRVFDSIKERRRQGTNFTFLASGGSTTAGAGDVLHEDRYFTQFAQNFISGDKSNNTSSQSLAIHIIDRGHGARGSFHSALLAESFFPPNPVDLIVWEFSMNDELHRCSRMEYQNPLLFWLLKLKQFYHPHPTPPVMLVYYWASPMALTVPANKKTGNYTYSSVKNTVIFNPVFDIHDSFAASFDFVIGHINVGTYLDTTMGWNALKDYKKAFVADDHHPNALGHALTARMMQELMTVPASQSLTVPAVASDNDQRAKQTEAVPQWFCGIDTKDKQRMKRLLLHSNKDKGPPITSKASFVSDLPRNAVNDQLGSLGITFRPINTSVSDYFWKELSQGKASDYRQDRQKLIQLPNCHREGRMVLEVMPHLGPVTALGLYVMNTLKGTQSTKAKLWKEEDGDSSRQLQESNWTDAEKDAFAGEWVQMMGGFSPVPALKIWVNGADYSDQIIDTQQWKAPRCQLTIMALYHRWLILDEGENVKWRADKTNNTTEATSVTTRIELCDASTDSPSTKNALALEHLVVL